MFNINANRLFSNLILDPYRMHDLQSLVHRYRQDFMNSVLKILDHKKVHSDNNFFKGEGKLRAIYKEIHDKRLLLDDIERAFDIAVKNEYTENERYEYMISALKEAEEDDEVRYEKKIEELDELVKRTKKDRSTMTYDQALLLDIKKQLAEIYLFIEKNRKQDNRRSEWELHPPSSILEGFKEYMKNSETNPFEESGSKTG